MRSAKAIGLVVVLLATAVAPLVAPHAASADEDEVVRSTVTTPIERAETADRRNDGAGPSLGALVIRDRVVQIQQTPNGFRYAITTRDGELLASELTQEQLETLAPNAAKSLDAGLAQPRLLAK